MSNQDPEPKDIWSQLLLVIVIVIVAIGLFSCKAPQIHQCNWEDCELVGQEMNQYNFKSTWGCEEMSDCYLVEITHFMNPEMTYEQCETYVMSGVE